MLTPLTKKRGNGDLYERFPKTVAILEQLIALPRDEIVRRLGHRSRTHAEFIPSECLMYMLREASRQGNRSAWFNTLFLALYARCERNLAHAVSYGAVTDAETVREDILGEFQIILARGLGPEPQRLDVFEVVFDKAFVALRKNILKKRRRIEHKEKAALQPADHDDEEGTASPFEPAQPEPDNAMGLNATELEIFRIQATERIEALPDKERRAVTLILRGYKIDASDPVKPSIAELCDVDERTVRNWLKSAAARLSDKLHRETP